jgi:hypothetical protein
VILTSAKRDEEEVEEEEEPGVMGVNGKPIPPAKWLLPLECKFWAIVPE